MNDSSPSPSARTRVRRLPARGAYDRPTLHAILDEGTVCHVAVVDGGHPFVLPMAYARRGDTLLLHGSSASRVMRLLAGGAPACVTVTLEEGLVLARSGFHHSMNYRSVMILGTGRAVEETGEKRRALDALVEHLVPGRTRHARGASPQELTATTVVALPLDEASAKIRTGPPADDEEDLALPIWAGVIPRRVVHGPPEPDDLTRREGREPPDYVTNYRRLPR